MDAEANIRAANGPKAKPLMRRVIQLFVQSKHVDVKSRHA
jgi:hypothetical protein